MTTSRVALGLMVVFLMGLGAPIAAADAAEVNGIYTEESTKDVGESTKLDVLKGLKFRGWIDTYFAGNFNDPRRAQVAQAATEQKPAAAADQPPAANPVPYPAMGGPLMANPNPTSFNLGPLGKVYVTGVVSGLGYWQSNPVPRSDDWRADLSNGQVFVQTTEGPVQFFIQAGLYSLPALGTPYLPASKANDAFYGPVPQAFLKFVPTENFSLMVGALPTLIGGETTFTFENFNIERGLLWNQENAVNRGVQANYTAGPVALSLSWNDGYYSGEYKWLWGSVAYTIVPNHTVSFVGGANLGTTKDSDVSTPLLQNNSQIYNLIYTGSWGPWSFAPYLQYTHVPANESLGIQHYASTIGFALTGSYAFSDQFKLAARAEYIASTGSVANGAPNLLYGPGSDAWSITVTPTYQYKILFGRAEFSYVGAGNTTSGFALGASGNNTSQARVMLEVGMLF